MTQTRQKQENKYEVKPQYEELSKQINMQHAINQCYECMRLSKEISQLGQCINRQIISSCLYTTVYQPGNHRSVITGPVSPSQLGGRHSYPVVTAPTIALDFSGMIHQSASHNVAPNQCSFADGSTEGIQPQKSICLPLRYLFTRSHGICGHTAKLKDPSSLRTLNLWTNAPGMQFYTADYINLITGKGGAVYNKHAAACLETQGFPNAINQPNFPSVVVQPGQKYQHNMLFEFSIE
ncbi:Galactose mutarotase-like superfamily protein isoform 1 [Dorcoceras hygrometricum]|uniref:Galactose mutarotase-like superfamily protein isoform 1 n=1 Tax=Dorcoceras hygrometricum TaxID=472368 RepID=A0A2Z7AHC6_9LAMI|nr:Galactose mutarotase-like superfamily protein isoform 1 [Dorcoceras hygrometricum]